MNSYTMDSFEIGSIYHVKSVPGGEPSEVLLLFRSNNCVMSEQSFRIFILASMEGLSSINPLETVPQVVDLKILNGRTRSVTKVDVSELPIYMGWYWVNPLLFEIIKYGSPEKARIALQTEEDNRLKSSMKRSLLSMRNPKLR